MAFDFSSIASMAGSSGGSIGGGGGTKGWNLRANPNAQIAASQSNTFTNYLDAANGMQQIVQQQPKDVPSPANRPGKQANNMASYINTAKMVENIVKGAQQKEEKPENLTGQTPVVATVEKPVVVDQPTTPAEK